ncbi:MAG: CRISPR-associated endoribonuclease Cas6 [Desulfotomaculales bacterium]
MRLKVKLESETKRTFFVTHDDLQQGLTLLVYEIFKAGDPDYASWLHDQGWQQADTPRFKLFSYSRLFSSIRHINRNGVFFASPEVWFYLSSPDPKVISVFSAGAAVAGSQVLGDTRLIITGVERLRPPRAVHGWLYVTTLSPFVISESVTMPSHPYRYLLLDREPDLVCRRLEKNAKLKWMCYGRNPQEFDLRITPLAAKPKYIYHGAAGFCFPCSEAVLRLEGPPEVLDFVYDAGLGEKTGMGYGCLGVYRGRDLE